MNVYERLATVQAILKAPKNQYNSFGKYNYRSCEDILEAAKPLCIDNGLVLTISDEIKSVGGRNYVEATATVIDIKTGEKHSVTGSAREAIDKKGMDDSQITGSTSSYARKYALNGLFSIDDTKDADTQPPVKKETKKPQNQPTKTLSEGQVKRLFAIAIGKGYNADSVKKAVKSKFNIDELKNMTKAQYDKMCTGYQGLADKVEQGTNELFGSDHVPGTS